MTYSDLANTSGMLIRLGEDLLRISMTGQLPGVVQVPCRCSGQLPGVLCRYPAGAQDSCQKWCRYPAGAQDSCQEWCRYPAGAQDSCQEWCRYPAGALASCPECCAEIGLPSLRLSIFQGVSLREFLLAPACPHREGNSMGGLPLFNVRIWGRRGCRERQSFCPNRKSLSPGLWDLSPVGYHFTLGEDNMAI